MKNPIPLIITFVITASAYLCHSQTFPSKPTDETEQLLKEVVATYKSMQSMTTDFSVSQKIVGGPPISMNYTGTAKVKRPDLYYYDCEGIVQQIMASDGKMAVVKSKPNNAYCQMPAGPQAMNQMVTAVAPLTLFFNPNKLLAPNTPTAYLGEETIDGTRFQIVEQTLGQTVMRYYIDGDKVVRRMIVNLEQNGGKLRGEMILTNIHRDVALGTSDFTIVVPQDAQLFEMPTAAYRPVAIGQPAPTFTLPRPDGGQITLDSALQGKKASLITFWFYACATCRQEFPSLQKLYEELKDKGLEVVAIDSNDDKTLVNKYVSEGRFSFPIGLDDDAGEHHGVAAKYGISLYPTSYLVDQDGKIVARFIGFNEKDLREALEKLGVK
jgi:peroxiredoxin/outer membrane lipoprotein-sorting protein